MVNLRLYVIDQGSPKVKVFPLLVNVRLIGIRTSKVFFFYLHSKSCVVPKVYYVDGAKELMESFRD